MCASASSSLVYLPDREAVTPPRGYRVLVHTPGLLVWRAYGGVPLEGSETDYGCVRPRGRIRVIDRQFETFEGGSQVTRIVSAGHLVAYAVQEGGKGGGGAALTVYNLARGRASFEMPVDAYVPEGAIDEPKLPALERLGAPVGRGADALALDAVGDVAWVGTSEAKSPQTGEAVLYLHDRSGLHKLAVASQITTLAFRGATLTWQQDGMAESAPA